MRDLEGLEGDGAPGIHDIISRYLSGVMAKDGRGGSKAVDILWNKEER